MNKPLNTNYTFTFEDGSTVEMTLSFYILYQLKGKKRTLYDAYSKIMTKGASDELEMISVLYTAYVCANLADLENIMSEEEFMMKCGSDRDAVGRAIKALIKPKN